MDQSKLKVIACAVGGLTVIVAGLIYLLVTDLYLLNSSQWLFYGAVTSFGAGLACLLSEGLRHKKIAFYVVKVLAVACLIAFILVILSYKSHCDISEVVRVKGYQTLKVNYLIFFVTVSSFSLSVIGAIFQGCGIILNLIYGIDD